MQWNDPAVVEALKQIERDMGQAMVAVDLEKLNRIFADDWTSIGASGAVVTKEKVLGNFKSGVDRLEAFELGPMDVQVKGNVAVVHGSVTEKRTRAGKDIGGDVRLDGPHGEAQRHMGRCPHCGRESEMTISSALTGLYFNDSRCCIARSSASSGEPRMTSIFSSIVARCPGGSDVCGSTC